LKFINTHLSLLLLLDIDRIFQIKGSILLDYDKIWHL
jgi:hypothetical protein